MAPPDPAPWAPRVVLGTWGISGAVYTESGPAGYSDVDLETAYAVLDAAYGAGVRWIDTAPGYGGGEGLRRIAEWQRSRGERWNVVIKPGRPADAGGPRSDVDPTAIRTELAGQALTGPSAVLVKDPPEHTFSDGSLSRLIAGLSADGYPIVGLATHRLDLVGGLGSPPVPGAVVQLEYHLLNRVTAVPASAAARVAGWRVWGMQPLAYGLLSGRYDADTTFGPDDWRSRIPVAVRRAFHVGVRSLPSWLPACVAGRTPAEIALAWCLAAPTLDRVVVGPKSVPQLETLHGAWELATDAGFRAFVVANSEAGEQPAPIRRA